MKNEIKTTKKDEIERNVVLISKIYQSFEALEETLGKLKLEEPLFITYIAKKSFAEVIFKNIEANQKKEKKERLKN